ncbi:MAG: FecR family protein, partial [Saonia sp.]
MSSLEIENCIIKFLCNEATTEELDYLSKWISIDGNEHVFDEYIKTYYEITTAMSKPDVEKIKKTLLKDIEKDKKRIKIRSIQSFLKYAAVFVFLIGTAYLYWQNMLEPKVESVLTPKDEPITITLDDGTTKIIEPEKSELLKDTKGNVIGRQDNSQLIYAQATKSQELIYNTLKVPYGKRFDIVLSDSTHVYLNAGTTLRYPINFIEGQNRNVFLTGEAYFEVTKDDDHPFVVAIGTMNVEVLGTVFNVSSYPQDSSINTVLVEGSVALYQKKDTDKKSSSTLLEPGFKAEWNKNDANISIENVDTRIYTAWVGGKLIFRNTPFLKIRQALER